MTIKRTCIVVCLLIAAAFCRADSAGTPLSASEYRSELDRLLDATQQLDSSSNGLPESLHRLPQTWHVTADQHDFDISTEGLQRDIRRYQSDKNAANAVAIRTRLQVLRNDIDGFEKSPTDFSTARSEVNAILSRREFRDVTGPTWLDHLKRRFVDFLLSLLQRVFRSAAIPNISKYFIYGLMAFALLALIYIAYRSIWRGEDSAEIVPRDTPVSAKEWAIWLAEARAAAAKSEWRDAIHLAYWAGISFLERQGFWKPDRARTPREYLRLLSDSSGHRQTLAALTRIFELAWYARRDATEAAFSQTLSELEKLGCQ